MNRNIAAALMAGAALIAATAQVHAQAAVQVQVVAACSSQSWPLNVTRPLTQKQNGDLCTNATGGGGGSSLLTAIAALPTLAPGDQQPRGSLAGAAYTQPVYGSTAGGGTQVDATHGLPIHGDGTALPVSVATITTITNPVGVKGVDGSTIAGSTNAFPVAGVGTAGTAAGGVLTIQGVASMTKLLVTPDSVALPANQSVNVSQVNGVTVLTGAGATGTGAQRETVSQDTSTVAGAAPLTTGIFVTGPSAAALATAALQSTINTSIGTLVTDTHFQNVVGTKNAGTAAANSLQVGLVYNSSPLTLTTGQQSSLQGDVNGNLKVTGGVADATSKTSQLYSPLAAVSETAASTIANATIGYLSMDPNNRALRVELMPGTATGSGNDVYEVAASDNHRVIKNGAGTLRAISYTNNSATLAYLRYYNAGTGFNGCNSATNILYEIGIPANTSIAGDNPAVPPNGIAFATGLSMCVTSGFGQTNTGNAVASAISINTGYD